MGNVLAFGKLMDLSERICPWAKYRGRVRLQVMESDPTLPDVVVAKDVTGRHLAVALLKQEALDEIRLKWGSGREIDTIPSDEEIAAWLAYCVFEHGEHGTIRES